MSRPSLLLIHLKFTIDNVSVTIPIVILNVELVQVIWNETWT